MGSLLTKVSIKKVVAFALISGGSIAVFLFYYLSKKPSISQRPNSPPTTPTNTNTSQNHSLVQLKGLRIICYSNDILLRKEDKIFYAIPSAIETLRALALLNDIYLITKVQTDQEESQVMHVLTEQNLNINPLKLLFCETDEGRVHVTRQLEGHVHIDSDMTVLTMLKPHVSVLVNINPVPSEVVGVDHFPSFVDFVKQRTK